MNDMVTTAVGEDGVQEIIYESVKGMALPSMKLSQGL